MTDQDPEKQGEEAPSGGPESPEVEAEPFEPEGGRTYDVPPPGEEGSSPSGGSPALAATCHLLGLLDGTVSIVLIGLIAPLILWLAMKDEDPEVDFAGKEAINFQINMIVLWLIGLILTPCLIGLVILPALVVVELVLAIVAAIKTLQGERYRYPYIFRVIV